MHKELLCATSFYFRAALNGNFKEAKEQVIEMKEEEIATFKHCQFWLYSRTFLMTRTKTNDIEYPVILDLYLGESRIIPQLQNDAIDVLIAKQKTSKWTPSDQISRIYENTQESSPLRRLFVDLTVLYAGFDDDAWFSDKTLGFFNKEFLFDLLKALIQLDRKLRKKVTDFTAVRSNYHVSTYEWKASKLLVVERAQGPSDLAYVS